MVMRSAVNQQLPYQGHFFNEDHPTDRFTPAGPDHAQIASVNGVIDYFEAVYSHHFGDGDADSAKKAADVSGLFQQAEHTNLQPLLDFITQKKGVRLIGKTRVESRAPTVSLTVEGREPGEIAAELAAQKIGIGNGNCYAYRLMEAIGIPPDQGVVRLSFVHYTTAEELGRLTGALEQIL
jgi:selenocysteine lyase/cysteine desulfurase